MYIWSYLKLMTNIKLYKHRKIFRNLYREGGKFRGGKIADLFPKTVIGSIYIKFNATEYGHKKLIYN